MEKDTTLPQFHHINKHIKQWEKNECLLSCAYANDKLIASENTSYRSVSTKKWKIWYPHAHKRTKMWCQKVVFARIALMLNCYMSLVEYNLYCIYTYFTNRSQTSNILSNIMLDGIVKDQTVFIIKHCIQYFVKHIVNSSQGRLAINVQLIKARANKKKNIVKKKTRKKTAQSKLCWWTPWPLDISWVRTFCTNTIVNLPQVSIAKNSCI